MEPESEAGAQKGTGWPTIASCLVFTLAMWLSLWLFLEDPHHRIGGVAWNGLFQALVVPLGALLSIIVFLSAAAGTLPRRSGVLVALAMGATALYCIRSVFSILMGV